MGTPRVIHRNGGESCNTSPTALRSWAFCATTNLANSAFTSSSLPARATPATVSSINEMAMRDVQRMVTTFLRVDRRGKHRMPPTSLLGKYASDAAASRPGLKPGMARGGKGGDGSGVALEVARQAAKAADPGEGSFDDPALGQDFESDGGGRAFDDLESGPRAGGHI